MTKTIVFHQQALDDLEQYKHEKDFLSLKYIQLLIIDIDNNGDSGGIGSPEKLTKDLNGWYSRRISWRNRLVYRTNNNNIEILMCKQHYSKDL